MVNTKMSYSHFRPAIAMIELIFAIVIMGIVLMSAPMLMSTATQSTTVGLQQEGINEASSKVNMILSYVWDEQDTDDNVTPPILHVTNGNSLFEPATAKDNRTRIGIPLKSSRMFFPVLDASSTLGFDSEENNTSIHDDVDDYNGETLTTLTSIESASTDYAESTTVKIETKVIYGDDSYTDGATYSYVPFASGTATSNVKNIEVKLTSTDTANADVLEKTIVFRAFVCNIGGVAYAEKWF
jgi:hypothetical protein